MKVRKDFVTNSSSSSFILAFSNEEEISTILNTEIDERYNGYKDELLKEIRNNRISKEGAIQIYKDEIYYDCTNERMEKYINDFAGKISSKDIVVMVTHGDGGFGEDGVLEHEILPKLSCTVMRISNH